MKGAEAASDAADRSLDKAASAAKNLGGSMDQASSRVGKVEGVIKRAAGAISALAKQKMTVKIDEVGAAGKMIRSFKTVSQQAKLLAKDLTAITGKQHKIELTMPNGKTVLENVKQIGSEVKKAGGGLLGKAGGAIKGAGGKLAGGAALAGRAMLAGGAAVGVASLAGGKKAFDSGVQMENYDVAMTHWFKGDKGKSDAYLAELRANARKTPFGTAEVIAGGTRALQVAGGDATKGMQYLKLAEDMAALNPEKSVSDAIEAIADGAMGEMERMKEFGFKGSKAEFDAAGGDLMKTKGADGKSLMDMYSGGTDKFANTTGGKIATIAGTLEEALQGVGTKLIEKATPLLDALIPITDAFAKSLPGALDTFISFVEPLGEPLGQIFSAVRGAVEPLIPTFMDIAQGVLPAVSVAFQLIATFVSSIVAPALKVIADCINLLVVPALQGMASFVQSIVIPALQSIGSFINDRVVPAFLTLSEFLGGAVKAAFDAVVGAANLAKNAFDGVKGAVDTAKNALSSIGDKVSSAVSSAVSFFQPTSGFAPSENRAGGDSYFRGGPVRINEMGGEAWKLPKGTKIYPSGKTTQMIANDLRRTNNTSNNKAVEYHTTININGANKTNKDITYEIEKVLKRLAVTA